MAIFLGLTPPLQPHPTAPQKPSHGAMDVPEHFLPPGAQLLDAAGAAVDGLAATFSRKAEGETGRVGQVPMGRAGCIPPWGSDEEPIEDLSQT